MMRRRLTSKQREALYQRECDKAREAGREHPSCNLCPFPILPGQSWDASHDPSKGRWLGGEITGIAHTRCNRRHGSQIETPKFAKSERVRKKFRDIIRPRSPMQGGREDDVKRTMRGEVVLRSTGEPAWRTRT